MTDEDGVSVGTGDRGKDHIVKLRRIVAEALDNAVTAVGADETGTGDPKHEVTPNTKTSGGTEVAESTEGSVEFVEANDADFGVAEVEEAYGLRPPEPVLRSRNP